MQIYAGSKETTLRCSSDIKDQLKRSTNHDRTGHIKSNWHDKLTE